jgi:hypothetical protein
MLITKFIPKVEELKDLDCGKNINKNTFYIQKGDRIGDSYVGISITGNLSENVNAFCTSRYTKITRTEMQAELAKYGKYFDFEEKVLRNLRWRAEKAEFFFYIDVSFEVNSTGDYRDRFSDNMFEIGNYHQTKEQADEYARQMIEYSRWLIK